MIRPVPLIRRFTPIPAHYQSSEVQLEQIWSLLGQSDRAEWGRLREEYRTVILADAGAGKTFELKAEAERLLTGGRAAFFIRIEDIDAAFGSAFEVGTAEAFESWLAGTEEAWFFLDSVDEVRLETPRAFETAIRAFADRIHDARQRAHVYISSRPYAWRSVPDRALVEELLPYAQPVAEMSGQDGGATVSSKAIDGASALQLYRLAPLDPDDIRIFAGHRGVADANALIDALERTQLWGLAQLPFDLEDILAVWQETGSLDSRLAVLERGLCRRLGPSAGNRAILPLDRALDGARRLALMATLTSETNIRMPGGEGGGLDAAAVLHDWSDVDINQLLNRGVFSDAIYAMTRFRHRESRELLAAQRLAELLREPRHRVEIEALLFRNVYGEDVVVPRTRPLLPWLMLFDAPIRDRALALQPEIATEGGDPARLPFDVRRAVLCEIVARIVADGSRGGDNTSIARIAQADLAEETIALLEAHCGNDRVVFFLGRLVWQGAMQAAAEKLAPIALDCTRSVYTRIVSARAVATVCGADACLELWDALNISGEKLPQRLITELVENAPPTMRSVELLLTSVEMAGPRERYEATGLSRAIHSLIDRLPLTSDRVPERPLVKLIEGITALLQREPHIERRECKVSIEFRWLMEPAMHAVERLIVGRSQACLEPAAMSVLSQVPALRGWDAHGDYEHKSKLGEMIPRWDALNDALFWHSVAATRAMHLLENKLLDDDWDVSWMEHFWSYDAASFSRTLDWIVSREIADDRSLALSRSFRTYAQNGRPRAWRVQLWRAVEGDPVLEAKLGRLMRPPPSSERKRLRATTRKWEQRRRRRDENEAQGRAQLIARLKADPDLLRAPPGLTPGEMSWDQAHVLQSVEGDGLRVSRRVGAEWQTLVPVFGQAVAEAFRDGAMRHWRAYWPALRSEGGSGTSIPYALIFAMTGLEIEAGEHGRGLTRLSADEVTRAMRYVPWELNGFPNWFQPFYCAHPESGFALMWQETRWELANSVPDQPMHYMLHDLVYHAPWLHADMALPIYDWLMSHGAGSHDVLRYSRAIMVSGGFPPEKLAALARHRVEDAATSRDQRASWFALWVDTDPDAAIPVFETALGALETPEDTQFSEQFITALVGGRRESGPTIGRWRTPAHLKTLYVLMHRYIRVAEDIDRHNGGVYSPTMRDDAQDARSHLFSLLSDIPGEATYREILALADDHPEYASRPYMRQKAYERAVADSDLAWSANDVLSIGYDRPY